MEKKDIKLDWKARGFSCDIWSDPPGQIWQGFVHETDELFMLIDGEVELRFDKNVFQPPAGEEILIPAKVPHTVINTGPVRNHWFYGYKRK